MELRGEHDALPPGTKVWLTACFYNPRGLSGLACNPISTNLQGGGVSLKAG